MKLLVTLLVFFSSSQSFSRDWKCDQLKTLPKMIEGCEGEACGSLTYERTVKDVAPYPSIDSKKHPFKIPKRTKIRYFEPSYILKKPG
jgi:hypothetical protein